VALALASAVAGAQARSDGQRAEPDSPPVYRVELIVFAHADGQSDRRRTDEPADFTGILDPLLVAAAHRAAGDALAAAAALPVLPGPSIGRNDGPRLASPEETLRPIPPVYAALGRLADPTERALERLVASSAHEPLAARAWTQPAPRGGSTPALRIHDETVVATRPPANALPLFFPSGLPVPAGVREDGSIRLAGLVRPAAPRLAIYRLDGTARLRRRQFLHLDLDLVWQRREPGVGPRIEVEDGTGIGTGIGPESGPETGRAFGAEGEREAGAAPHPRPWLTHRLRQSRVVEPGRFEYFDSSRFGVLARVTRFEKIVPEPEERPATTPPAEPQDPGPAATGGAG
jgi:hypothetical protein